MADQVHTPTKGLFVTAIGLFAVGMLVMPLWDSVQHPAYLVVGAVGTAAFVAASLRAGDWRWAVVILGVCFTVLYSGVSSGTLLLERSRTADKLPSCETGLLPPGVSAAPALPMEGPHLKTGEPCVQKDENRDDHRQWVSGGDFQDGFKQVIVRFPGDELRLILGPTIALFLMAFGGVLLAKATAHGAE
jgi:hypothetical protein